MPNLRRSIPLLTALLSLGLLGCRSEGVSHFKVPKEALAPADDGHDHGDGQAGHDHAAEAGAAAPRLTWSLPKGWSEAPGDGMRFATFKTPIAGRLEATVVVLPGPAGGELANVNRWRGQIQLAPLDEAALAAARATVKSKAGAVNLYDFTNEAQRSRMLAGLVATPDGNTWFLKLTGDAGPVAQARPDFLRILESLRLD
ncbi:hypothetical protein [Geothrix sp. 21YS21S-4]|uniref:hypothetical protein n=1 Tax=Geothrix sp. 21YS21S-4 TaxID=3068889 RepID=UPI0027B89B51|nr:hypothetical protein [Geothrix sp. 21YS21S-4]